MKKLGSIGRVLTAPYFQFSASSGDSLSDWDFREVAWRIVGTAVFPLSMIVRKLLEPVKTPAKCLSMWKKYLSDIAL